jgi:hypothetical protein
VRSVALTQNHPLAYIYALALAAGALLASSPSVSLTLGNVTSQSALGQPLRIVIPVRLAPGEALEAACIRLVADNSDGGAPSIVTARVSVEQAKTGTRVVITQPKAFGEPALNLSVQTGCGSTIRRDYALLFDPPGNEAPTVLAAADVDPPAWAAPVRAQRVAAAVPGTKWGTPVLASAPAPERPAPEPARSARESAPPATAPAAAPPAPAVPAVPRELIATVTNAPRNSFISEAGAASLPVRTEGGQASPLKSFPLLQSSAPRPAPAHNVWQMMWPYLAGVLGTMALALLAFFVSQRRTALPHWVRRGATADGKEGAPTITSNATFAHFGAMTEPAPAPSRDRIEPQLAAKAPAVAASEHDTLFDEVIDERSIKDAWREAAADPALDMGGESILKAIDAAEQDLRIGTPPPAQVAMDKALDDDLLTVPNIPTGVRFG